MVILNNIKTWFGTMLLASKLLAGDSTNAPVLSMTNQEVSINPSATARVYSLLENTNLFDNVWNETESQRGNGSNLVFLVNQDSPSKFFRARADYSPFSPRDINVEYHTSSNPHDSSYYNLLINNYLTNNINISLSFEETFNVYGMSYIFSPTNYILIPGENNITTRMDWLNPKYGARVDGIVHLSENKTQRKVTSKSKVSILKN